MMATRSRITSCAQVLSSLLFLFLQIDSSWAQILQSGSQSSNEPINVTADKLSAGDGGSKIEATGNVEVKRQLTTLKAQDVSVDRQTQDVEAKGNVSLDDPEWKIKSADSVQMNLEKETGEIQNGDLFIEQGHLTLSGRRFQKFVGQSYHVDEGFFTTCLCDSGPSPWRISGDSVDLRPDGVGTIRGGYFYIFDVPVLYLPYGFFPVKTERQSGFLVPKIGQSTTDGFRYQQPFFWAISKSTDATIAGDFESRSRWGALGELRTIINRDSDFQLNGSYFNEALRTRTAREEAVGDNTIADQNIPTNRWNVIGTHRYLTTSNWLTYSDIAAYGDTLFTRELVDRFDLSALNQGDVRESRFAKSQFGVFRGWGDTFLKGDWNFYQDFIQPKSTTLQKTPQVVFWGRRLLQNFPLEFRWRAEGVNYWGGSECSSVIQSCISAENGNGLRLDLRPELVFPFKPAPYLYGALSIAPRETIYHLYSLAQTDRNISRELVEIRGKIATSVSRVFTFAGETLKGIKHVIEPELSYLFIPGVNQRQIPIMDYVDRINRRNVVTFGLTNRFLGKFTSPLAVAPTDQNLEVLNPLMSGDVREVGSLRLALSYDLNQEIRGADSLSDLDMGLRLTPLNYLVLGFDGGVHPGTWHTSQARATFGINDPRPLRPVLDPDFNRPNSVFVSYQFLGRSPNGLLAENANINLDVSPDCANNTSDPRCTGFNKDIVGQVAGAVVYHLHDQVMLLLSTTYDVRDNRFPGYHGAVKFLSGCECWSITLSFNRDINPAKTSFNFNFNLLGLGAQKNTLN